MQAVTISGRFVSDSYAPEEGFIVFSPSRPLVMDKRELYAPLEAHQQLDQGRFCVTVSRTDTADEPWYYVVQTPWSSWNMTVTCDGPALLSTLLAQKDDA